MWGRWLRGLQASPRQDLGRHPLAAGHGAPLLGSIQRLINVRVPRLA